MNRYCLICGFVCAFITGFMIMMIFQWRPYLLYGVMFSVLGLCNVTFSVFLVRIGIPLLNLEKEFEKLITEENDGKEDELFKTGSLMNYADKIRAVIFRIIEIRNKKMTIEAVDSHAAYEALHSQINPHFLYNILETIRGQALIDDDEMVAVMIETLSNFFRYSISRKGSMVTFRDEIENIQNYMKIQKYRFRDRFNLVLDIPTEYIDVYECQVPRLILQPIIENAIVHGFKDMRKGGIINVSVELTENIIIRIVDNGKGMDKNTLEKLNDSICRSNRETKVVKDAKQGGIALSNVNERLKMLYGEIYGINIYSIENNGTTVEMEIPRIKGY